uniref:SGNH/GDSL hydrolase family protein n=1 Tax=Bifidobacterium adolescentis TaxID=1680 RepID=UPI004028FFF5
MSTIYDKTDNYALNLYGDNDPADLRDGYNGSMHVIDDVLKGHLDRIESAETQGTHEEAVVKALLGDNTEQAATASKAKWDKAGTDALQGITAAATATSKADVNTKTLQALGADSVQTATAAKTKWDKAGTDALEGITAAATAAAKADSATVKAESNSGILNALGANTVASAAGLASKWNGYDARFSLYDPIFDWTRPTVVFGDSIALGTGTGNLTTDAWPRRFAALTGSTDVRMYATNNAGFTAKGTDGKTVIQQIQSVPADQRDNVGTVIISAGINDFNVDAVTLLNAMRSATNEAIRDFPNAAIIVVPCLCGNSPRIVHNVKTLYPAVDRLSAGYTPSRRLWIVPYAWEINAFRTNNYNADNVHLSTAGAAYTAKVVADYVFHGWVTRANCEPVGVTLGPGITSSNKDMTIGCTDGVIHLQGQIVLGVKVTAFTRFLNFPDGYFYERIIPGMISTTGASLFYVQGYGNTVDSFSNIDSGATVYANASWTYGV